LAQDWQEDLCMACELAKTRIYQETTPTNKPNTHQAQEGPRLGIPVNLREPTQQHPHEKAEQIHLRGTPGANVSGKGMPAQASNAGCPKIQTNAAVTRRAIGKVGQWSRQDQPTTRLAKPFWGMGETLFLHGNHQTSEK